MSMYSEIILDMDFWDCECDEDFIHSRFREFCIRCGSLRSEQPNSRANEVSHFVSIGKIPQSTFRNPQSQEATA